MRLGRSAAVVGALALLALPSSSLGGEPPNPNDPCSSAGKNTCGTLGVGSYRTYRYGIRWFGDFRGAVQGEAHTYCIDLGYWYPSPDYRFRESSRALRNRNDEPVSLPNQQRLAYAVWQYGRTTNPDQAAAVMLYVHSLMGDARPGEVDPAAVGLAPLYERVARDAGRLHGPYRMTSTMPDNLVAGREATATVRVLAAGGAGVPDVELTVTPRGATGAPGSVRTNEEGVARISFTPAAETVRLAVRTEPLASTLPRVFSPTTAATVRNGQRLVAPGSQTVSGELEGTAGKTRITVSSAAEPAALLVGEQSRDRLTIRGALESYRGEAGVQIYGPFPSAAAVRCDGAPVFKSTFRVTGAGEFMSPPATLGQVGWYSYVEAVPGDASHIGATTPCRAPGETFRVETQPRLQSIVSTARVVPGTVVHDRVIVSGLAGQPVTVQAALYGPFASADAIDCSGKAVWTGSLDVTAEGEVATADVPLAVPGYYAYHETIAAGGFVRAAQTDCKDPAETVLVPAQPQVTTKVSDQETRPGASITDTLVVKGLGALSATVNVKLWGPFATRGGISCSGTPFWTGSVVAKGDGTYTTQPVEISRAGYFVYQESIAESEATAGTATACGDVAETTFARAAPAVTTVASAEVVFPGATIFDTIDVRGLGRTAAAIDVQLYGPFATRAAMSCTGRPFWQGRVYAKGNGRLRTPSIRVQSAGFYTFRERLVGSPAVAEHTTECALVVETSLARPAIITGRGEVTRYVAAPAADGPTPRRVRIAALGIDAPVFSSGIDVRRGVLGVPPSIARTGWWRDGAAPGASAGAILIAGHVDSARLGPGAFFRLKDARRGQRVQVAASNGRIYNYRVVSVREYLKEKLPTSVYSRTGRPRLVLATCGGPFLEAQGHYRDNIVLTAVPA
jgi:hypothetical protein